METTYEYSKLLEEFEQAKQIEEVLLKGKTPPILSFFDKAHISIPLSRSHSGDFFDFFQPHEEILDVVFGDVMGKGIPAGYVALAAKMQFLRFALPVRKKYFYQTDWDWEKFALPIEEIVSRISFFMTPSLMELGFFITLFYGRFNFREMTFTYIDCGSTKPLVFNTAENREKWLSGDHLPLGAAKQESFSPITIPFTKDDLFLFYSDGLVHGQGSDKQILGEDEILKWVREESSKPCEGLLDTILAKLVHFTGSKGFDDDLTLLALKPEKVFQKPKNLFEKEFKSSLEELPALRKWVKNLCRKALGDTHKLGEKLELVLNEAFCNICLHAYEGDTHHLVLISARIEEEGIRIDIKDEGLSFDPSDNQKPDLSGKRDHGFGLHLMEKLVDQMVYYPKGFTSKENTLTFFKRFEGA